MQLNRKRVLWKLHVCVVIVIWIYSLLFNTEQQGVPVEKVVSGLMRFTLCYVLFFAAVGAVCNAFRILYQRQKD